MPSGRRPPPPPPPNDDVEKAPPPLPERNGVSEKRQNMEFSRPTLPARNLTESHTVTSNKLQKQQDDVDDTYEQPASQSSNNITIPGSDGGVNFSSLCQSIPVAGNSDSENDGGWSESEWEDSATLDTVSTSQSDDTYLMPDGVPKDGCSVTNEVADLSRKHIPSQRSNIDPPKLPTKPKPSPKIQADRPKPPIRLPAKPLPNIRSASTEHKDSLSEDNNSANAMSSGSAIGSPDAKSKKSSLHCMPNEADSNSAVMDTEVYDDGASEVLSRFDWFHGELDREEGIRRVKQLSENGAFLVRASKTDVVNNSHPYTLVVTLDRKAYNLKIRLRKDNRFAIGTFKSDEVSFPSVPELVEHHRENNIKLAEGGVVKLKRSPKK